MEFDEFGSPIGGNWWDYIIPPSNEEAPGSAIDLTPTPAQQIDYSGATYVGSTNPSFAPDNSQDYSVFRWDTGEEIQTSPTGEIVAYQPGYSTYENPANVRPGYQNTPYAFSDIRSGDVEPGYTMFQGQKVPVAANEYLINPVTGKVILDERGNPIIQGTINPNMGGDNWVKNTGLLTQLAMAGMIGSGLYEALGAGATGGGGGIGLTGASGAKGAMGAGSTLQLAPSAGTIGGFGSVSAPSLATGLGVGSGGVLGGGALSAETVALIEAMNAGPGFGLNASQVPNLAEGLELGNLATAGGATGIDSLLSSLGSVLKTPLGQLGAMGGLSLLSSGGGAAQKPVPQLAGGTSTYAPKGQVDYTPILNLLAPKQIARSTNSLLG